MRDLVWTLIIIWLVYRLVAMFKSSTPKKGFAGYQQNHTNTSNQETTNTSFNSHTAMDVKTAVKKSTDKEGEYVDYEEIK